MKQLVPCLLVAVIAGSSSGNAQEGGPPDEVQALREISWSAIAADGALQSGEIFEDDAHGQVLRLEHSGPGPAFFPLATIDDPQIPGRRYAVRGRTRYQNVEGTGFLEMWSYFPDGSQYFSRTLASGGEMQSIAGSSPWREFALPFDLGADPAPPKPNRLAVNLQLPGPGVVYISDVRLVTLPENGGTAMQPGAWWDDRTGGVIGGGVGSLLGLLLAAAGILIGVGRCRPLVLSIVAATGVLGLAALAGGVAALLLGQPYAVFYPLLLIGVLGLFLGIGGVFLARYRYQQAELRRMQALDA